MTNETKNKTMKCCHSKKHLIFLASVVLNLVLLGAVAFSVLDKLTTVEKSPETLVQQKTVATQDTGKILRQTLIEDDGVSAWYQDCIILSGKLTCPKNWQSIDLSGVIKKDDIRFTAYNAYVFDGEPSYHSWCDYHEDYESDYGVCKEALGPGEDQCDADTDCSRPEN